MIIEEESTGKIFRELDMPKNDRNLQYLVPTATAPTASVESPDFSFTQGLGTTEQVATRKVQRTQNPDRKRCGKRPLSRIWRAASFEILYQWGKLIGEGVYAAPV
jgi:hypothetical protein